jgi:hypothetical protein
VLIVNFHVVVSEQKLTMINYIPPIIQQRYNLLEIKSIQIFQVLTRQKSPPDLVGFEVPDLDERQIESMSLDQCQQVQSELNLIDYRVGPVPESAE